MCSIQMLCAMNMPTRALAIAWLATLLVLAWAASLPDPYLLHVAKIPPPHPYEWKYPLTFGVVGLITIFLLQPWRLRHSFIRAIIAFSIFASLFALVFLSIMHSPEAHGYMLGASFFWSLALLFYSGYALAKSQVNNA